MFFLLAGPLVALVASQARPPFELIGQSTELGFLQRIGASAAYATQFLPSGPPGAQTKDLRVAAYCRLGRIGTLDSLDSMGRIEDGIMKIYRERDSFWPNLHTLPQWHALDGPLAPVVTLETKEGVIGIFADTELGRHDFYVALTRSPLRANAPWTRPLLLPFLGQADVPKPELHLKEDRLTFSYSGISASGDPARVEHSFRLREIERDTDKDGWTDIEEARLGLNP
ncbi:MAG: hypothetical protein HY046_10205, partial [Acidobacteria bacterium]|nr:hypothetical protein [Acidobacteriota bacterium]